VPAGTFENRPRPPGYRDASLWKVLTPASHTKRSGVADQPGDYVRTELDACRRLTVVLLRDNYEIDRYVGSFQYAHGGDHLRQHQAAANGHFPLLWWWDHKRLEIGLDGEMPRHLLVTCSLSTQLWVLCLPTLAGGGGPGLHFLYRAVDGESVGRATLTRREDQP
jgi:hypothetical protein